MKRLLLLLPIILLSSCTKENKREKEERYLALGASLVKKVFDDDIKDVINQACEEHQGTYANSKIQEGRCIFYVPKNSKVKEAHINITVYMNDGKENYDSFEMYGCINTNEQDDELKYDRWNGTYSNEMIFDIRYREIVDNYVYRGVILNTNELDAYLSSVMNK